MDKTKIYESAAEFGALHNEDCCVHVEDAGACNVSTRILDCCENMRMVKSIINDTIAETVEFISHDMNCKDEAQRQAVVKAYLTGQV